MHYIPVTFLSRHGSGQYEEFLVQIGDQNYIFSGMTPKIHTLMLDDEELEMTGQRRVTREELLAAKHYPFGDWVDFSNRWMLKEHKTKPLF